MNELLMIIVLLLLGIPIMILLTMLLWGILMEDVS